MNCPYCNNDKLQTLEATTELISGFSVYCFNCVSYGPFEKEKENAEKKYDLRFGSNLGCTFCGNLCVKESPNRNHLECYNCYAIGPLSKNKKFDKDKKWI